MSDPVVSFETEEEVEATWYAYQLRPSFVGWPHRNFEYGFLEVGDAIRPHVDGGRWVADCPYCRTGMAAWPKATTIGVACLGCGRRFRNVTYPTAQMIAAAEKALAARPERYRAWLPTTERAADLSDENEAHGFERTGDPLVETQTRIDRARQRGEALTEAQKRVMEVEERKRRRRETL